MRLGRTKHAATAHAQAAREKNGVYVPLEKYNEMQLRMSGTENSVMELEGVLKQKTVRVAARAQQRTVAEQ